MNITEMLGTPVGDAADVYFPEEKTCSVPASMPTQQAADQRSHGIWIALGLIVAGAVGLATGFFLSLRSAAAPPSPGQATAHSISVPTSVDSFAEFATALWLTGMAGPGELASMYATAPPETGNTGVWVNRTTTLSTTPLGNGLYEATIAADVLELVDGAYESAGIQYFEVTVAVDGAPPVVVSGPARVPAPAPTPLPPGAHPFGNQVPPDQAAALDAFFSAYLTGQGDLARYVSATSRIPVFLQPPYAGVAVSAVGADSLGRVNVQIEATTVSGFRHALEYVVDLTFESGVWEVAGLGSSVLDDR